MRGAKGDDKGVIPVIPFSAEMGPIRETVETGAEVEKRRNTSINIAQCRRATTAGTPILLYQPDEEPAMIIAANPAENRDKIQTQAHSLLSFVSAIFQQKSGTS
jgi:hypothetical protein